MLSHNYVLLYCGWIAVISITCGLLPCHKSCLVPCLLNWTSEWDKACSMASLFAFKAQHAVEKFQQKIF